VLVLNVLRVPNVLRVLSGRRVPSVRVLAPVALALAAPIASLALAPAALSARLALSARPPLSSQPPSAPTLRSQILAIRAIDNHAHVTRAVPGDTDYDALPFALLDPAPPGVETNPVPLRADNPMFVTAWKTLFAYPHADATPAHLKDAVRLKQRAI